MTVAVWLIASFGLALWAYLMGRLRGKSIGYAQGLSAERPAPIAPPHVQPLPIKLFWDSEGHRLPHYANGIYLGECVCPCPQCRRNGDECICETCSHKEE